MIACVDVDYRDSDNAAVAACLVFERWQAEEPLHELSVKVGAVEPYVPGEFYKRELPCVLAVLERVDIPLDVLIVDGHVWLGEGRPGLGAHVFEALGQRVAVVGVAKNHFEGGIGAPVLRGESQKPLYVTAAGLPAAEAAARVREMHGEHRIPTLLKRVDQLCRSVP